MPSLRVDLDRREYRDARAARGGRPWRQVILEALDVEETPRKIGRPKEEP